MSPRPSRLSPAELCASWPDISCEDPVAEFARQFALNLRAAIGATSIREVARQTGVDRTVIGLILGGASWPDMVTIVRLEMSLGRIWPAVNGRPG
ncbi:MAG: hypothetical protein ABIX44_06680 [Cryobacterium sp.]